jgi:hypothetical protein
MTIKIKLFDHIYYNSITTFIYYIIPLDFTTKYFFRWNEIPRDCHEPSHHLPHVALFLGSGLHNSFNFISK